MEYLEKLFIVTAASFVGLVLALAFGAIFLLVISVPFRFFRRTREPAVAAGIPAVICFVWALWYEKGTFFRVALLYGVAWMAVVAFWMWRDGKKEARKQTRIAADSLRPVSERSDQTLVQNCLAEVDRAEREMKDGSARLYVAPDLLHTVRMLIGRTTGTVEAIRVHGVSTRNVAWLVISNVAGRMVASGQHHVYRGLLGTTGEDLQKVYLRAVSELERGGYYKDADGAARDRTWLRDRIAEVG